jgi:hypothetical protein
VSSNGTRTLSPGSYRDITVHDGGTLNLSTGTYYFRSLSVESGGQLVPDVTNGPVTINTTQDIDFDHDTQISYLPSSVGDNGSLWLTFNSLQSNDLEIGHNSRILCSINAPNSEVKIRHDVAFKGSICADKIKANEGVTALYHTSTRDLPFPKSSRQSSHNVTPSGFVLEQNFPNPFNQTTSIQYYLPNDQQVRLRVFDFYGREVATLVNSHQSTGSYTVQFNAIDLPSGTYFCRLESDGVTVSRVMTLMK